MFLFVIIEISIGKIILLPNSVCCIPLHELKMHSQ